MRDCNFFTLRIYAEAAGANALTVSVQLVATLVHIPFPMKDLTLQQ